MPTTRSDAASTDRSSVEDPDGGPAVYMTSTEARNHFGRLLDAVARGETVLITRQGSASAVVMSVAGYQALTGVNFDRPRVDLDLLAKEFDELFLGMQTPEAREGALAALRASPEELGRIAVAAAQRDQEAGSARVMNQDQGARNEPG
ncbi:MAG TPA: type II toxin-antitoxin system prevent-host-death family antitoxin [Longimicrobium sp.]|nr:type II toxin-antitoxin system prevent-host-death family antitoxin [Longimicrobium sp.]